MVKENDWLKFTNGLSSEKYIVMGGVSNKEKEYIEI